MHATVDEIISSWNEFFAFAFFAVEALDVAAKGHAGRNPCSE
jgi:hypothetical protein